VLDLLYVTRADVRIVLRWKHEHLEAGWLDTTRSKTQHPIRIQQEGEVAKIVQRCLDQTYGQDAHNLRRQGVARFLHMRVESRQGRQGEGRHSRHVTGDPPQDRAGCAVAQAKPLDRKIR